MRQQGVPLLFEALPLGIKLRQASQAARLKTARHRSVIEVGREKVLRVYGTLRLFSATQVASDILTRRNSHELPSCLRFDPRFIASCRDGQWVDMKCVAPAFAEWLMGLPRNWTSLAPLPADAWQGLPVLSGNGHRNKHSVLSLFSGCGALDLGLSPWCDPVAFCEIDQNAAAVLRARMADGVLPTRPVFSDVRDISTDDLRKLQKLPDGIVAGFPCVDLSIAGNMRGFSGHQSSLVREVFRIIDGCTELKFVFLENVDNIRAMPEFWEPLLVAFCEHGFSARWVSLEGRNIGCQQRRRRWFLLAVRGSLARFAFADP